MRNYIFIVIFFLFHYSCISQSTVRDDANFVYSQNNLEEYQIDTCLVGLLKDVAELDSNFSCFPPNKFYYDLTFENRGENGYMSIIPSRWEKSSMLDFKGVIKIGQVFFLCRGDVQENPLFIRQGKVVKVNLRKPKVYEYDSIDVAIETFAWKPTLAGKYTYCKGVPIDLYILVGKKLNAYTIKENE